MAAAQINVTTVFTLAVGTSTQLAPPNSSRREVMITNNDTVNAVQIAHGTNNQAQLGGHRIPPGGKMTLGPWEASWGWNLDIAASAVSGTPQIAYTEISN